jgi:hypothetical protein
MNKDYVVKFRKSFPALKLILGGNEQALILTDLLEAYALRCSDEWFQRHGEYGITEDGLFAKSRTLIMEDTGVLTASVKNAIDSLEEQDFILQTSLRHIQGREHNKKVLHYKINDDVFFYLNKADDYLYKKNHRPDDKDTAKKILLPFMNHLSEYNRSIIEALNIGNRWRNE